MGLSPCTACFPAPIHHGRGHRGPAGRDRRLPPGQRMPDSPRRRYLKRRSGRFHQTRLPPLFTDTSLLSCHSVIILVFQHRVQPLTHVRCFDNLLVRLCLLGQSGRAHSSLMGRSRPGRCFVSSVRWHSYSSSRPGRGRGDVAAPDNHVLFSKIPKPALLSHVVSFNDSFIAEQPDVSLNQLFPTKPPQGWCWGSFFPPPPGSYGTNQRRQIFKHEHCHKFVRTC